MPCSNTFCSSVCVGAWAEGAKEERAKAKDAARDVAAAGTGVVVAVGVVAREAVVSVGSVRPHTWSVRRRRPYCPHR